MALLKKKRSRSLETANLRLVGLSEIDREIDFGSGFDLDNYNALYEETSEVLRKYNSYLKRADEQRDILDKLERQLNDANERVLFLIGGFFGKDSLEYQKVGGTRKSKFNNNRPVTYDPNGTLDSSGTDESGDGTETP
ncbi:hypothetical protein [Gracilimonas tropica]|uniref:hypothetical protein n=1 Tax=Gracilimonas tropica TaxID=454600 RepID=UPI000364DCEA|nr:hypothetical protein [Gracilimonas tropica]